MESNTLSNIKYAIQKVIPAIIAFIVDLQIHHHIQEDGSLSHSGLVIVLTFCALLTYHVTEWIIFSFFEWRSFEKTFHNQKREQDKFYREWDSFKNEWNQHKQAISELKQSKSRTGKVLDKFAKSNHIVDIISNKLSDDLELDELMTNQPDEIQKDFHYFISSLKYQEFLASHFIINAKEKEVLQIPSFYFKHKIWSEFIDKAYRYLSVQLMDSKQVKEYLQDKERLEFEIKFLDEKTDGENSTHIEKIFVIKKEYFDKSGKVNDNEMKKYLSEWNKEFKDKYNIIPIMVIKEDDAIGIFRQERSTLTDIGIFGDVFGIQSINEKDGKFYTDDLKINFYFDKTKTEQKVKYFNKLKVKAKPLKDVL